MFKKIFLLIFAVFLLLTSVIGVTAKCSVSDRPGGGSLVEMLENCQEKWVEVGTSGTGITSIKEQIQKISTQALQFAGLFAVGALVWSGIQYTIAYGDSSRLESAKKTAIFSIIGLVVALASYSLVNAVLYFLFSMGTK